MTKRSGLSLTPSGIVIFIGYDSVIHKWTNLKACHSSLPIFADIDRCTWLGGNAAGYYSNLYNMGHNYDG